MFHNIVQCLVSFSHVFMIGLSKYSLVWYSLMNIMLEKTFEKSVRRVDITEELHIREEVTEEIWAKDA